MKSKEVSSSGQNKSEQYDFSNNQKDIMLRALSSDFAKSIFEWFTELSLGFHPILHRGNEQVLL